MFKLAPMSEDTRYVFLGRRHPDANVFFKTGAATMWHRNLNSYSTFGQRSTTDCTNKTHKYVIIVDVVGMSFKISRDIATELRLSQRLCEWTRTQASPEKLLVSYRVSEKSSDTKFIYLYSFILYWGVNFIQSVFYEGRGSVWAPLRQVHTCNVTAYRNAVTLQVTDTIRSYELNFHSVPHGVTVSCER